MIQLKHYKTSVRKDALVGLRDLFQANPDHLLPNLAKLVEQGMSAMVDDSSQVRRALCSLLNLILTNVSSKQLMPFSSLFIAHLSCGLTHIDDQIQLDSVKILEVFLSQPSLIVPYANELLSLLMKLISRQRNSSALQSRKPLLTTLVEAKTKTGGGTLLASNPDSKLADQMSRLRIFTFLSKFAEAIFEYDEDQNSSSKFGKSDLSYGSQAPIIDTIGKRVYVPTQEGGLVETSSTLADLSTSIPHAPVLKASGIFVPNDKLFERDPSSSGNSQQFPNKHHSKKITQSLLTLLLESWIECAPSNQGKELSQKTTTFSLMEIILRLIVQVLKLVPLRDRDVVSMPKDDSLLLIISREFMHKFRAHCLSRFPFSPLPSFVDRDSNLTRLDLLLCLNSVKLIEASCWTVSARAVDNIKRICSYIGSFSLIKHSTAPVPMTQSFQNCVPILIEFFPALLKMASSVKANNRFPLIPPSIVREMIKRVFNIYSVCHPMSKNKQLFLQCFSELLRSELDSGPIDIRFVKVAQLPIRLYHSDELV